MHNLQKWVNLSFLAGGVLVSVFLREIFALAFDLLGWTGFDWFMQPADIAGVAVGIFVFIFLMRSVKANDFLSAVYAELAKVTWPKRKEAALSTGVVAVLVAIATMAILFFDTIWKWISDKAVY